MLKDVDVRSFTFTAGFLERTQSKGDATQKRIDLAVFVPIAKQEAVARQEFVKTNNAHNLTNVRRIKSEMGIFSDYPHYFTLKMEGQD